MFDTILSVFFPEHCHGCGISGTALCRDCFKTIPSSLPIIEPANSFALFDYSHPLVQKAVWELKYHRKSALAKKLAEYGAPAAYQYVQSLPVPTIVLVPIPQHFSKTYSRGFNQSALLCQWLQPALGATIQQLLKKVRATDAQAHAHDRDQRQKNLANSMKATSVLEPDTLYIVLDDVITTGSTITEASRALRTAGAVHVCAIALAHGYAGKR